MAVTAKLFGLVFTAAFNAEIDLLDHAIHVTLHTSTYSPNQDTHDFLNDVTNEVTGTGYTAGGQALTGKSITYTAGTNVWMFDADNVQWTSSTITARTAVIHDRNAGTDATRPLIGYQQESADVVSTNGTWEIQWAAGGIISITVA